MFVLQEGINSALVRRRRHPTKCRRSHEGLRAMHVNLQYLSEPLVFTHQIFIPN